jgi:anti-sigma B factor antagonist
MVCRAPPGLSPAHVIGSAVPHCAAHEASLRLTSRADRGGCVIAALGGELGIASAPALREQFLSLLRAASHLIIDLSAVEHADASGLAVLVGCGRRARLLGGSLRLAAPSPEVTRVLSATGLNQHLDIFPTVRAATTGQPGLPEAIFPPPTVPARGRIDRALAGAALQSAMPASDRATARAGQGLSADWSANGRGRGQLVFEPRAAGHGPLSRR